MAIGGGLEAWRVFGKIGLSGLGKSTAQLNQFNAKGLLTGNTIAGLEKKTLLLAAGAAVAGVAVVRLGTKSVGAFADFDAAMTKSLAIMGEVNQTLEGEMVQAARSVARETLFSAEQAAESYFFLASAGLSAEQSIAALPQVASFAQAGMFDMARATDLATDAQSALGLTVDNAAQNLKNLTRVTDVLVKANTLANATVEQFSTALTSDAGAAAKSFKVPMEEAVAVLAAYADQGVKAEKAGSAFGRLLRLLVPAAVKNSEAFDKLGIEIFDAEGNLQSMADIIRSIENALQGMSVRQKSTALEMLGFQKRTQQVILPLIGAGDAVGEYTRKLGLSAGVTQEVADKQLQTIRKQMELLGGEISDVVLGTGEWIAVTTNLVGGLRGARTAIVFFRNELSGLTQKWHEARSELEAFGRIPGLDRLKPADTEFNRVTSGFLAMARAQEVAAVAAERAAQAEDRLADKILETNRATLESRQAFADLVTLGRGPDKIGSDQVPTLPDLPDLSNIGAPNLTDVIKEGIGQGAITIRMPDDSIRVLFAQDAETESSIDEILQRQFENAWPRLGKDKVLQKHATNSFVEITKNAGDSMVSEVLPSFQQAGGDLIRGLVSGSFDMEEFLKQSFITIASNFVLGPLAGVLGIASPSKVTAEMGRQMVTGLAVGIQEGARSGVVAHAWAGVVNGLPDISSAASRVTPTLRIDMSNMPPARNPLESARDADWQRHIRAGMDQAFVDGMRLPSARGR